MTGELRQHLGRSEWSRSPVLACLTCAPLAAAIEATMEIQSTASGGAAHRIPKRVWSTPMLTQRLSGKSEERPSRSPRQGLPGAFRNISVCCWTIQTRWIFHEAVTLGELQFQKTLQHSWVPVSLRWQSPTGCQSHCDWEFFLDVGGPHSCETCCGRVCTNVFQCTLSAGARTKCVEHMLRAVLDSSP